MNGRAVFVDSSGWIALLHERDSLHEKARTEDNKLMGLGGILVTTSLVLVEVAGVLAEPQVRGLAVELERRFRETDIDRLVWVDEDLYRRGWDIYRERSDKQWSLVDCVSFVAMWDRNVAEVFGADHHFAQAGFRKLL